MYLHSVVKWYFARQHKSVPPMQPTQLPDKPAVPASLSAELNDVFDRLPVTPRLPVDVELGRQPAPSPAPAPRQLQWMRSPHQLGLDRPELLLAYDGHFCRQGDNLFAADGCTLGGAFFVDVQLLDSPLQALRLGEALWGTTGTPDYFRGLAHCSLPALCLEVGAAAARAQVPLDAERQRRCAELLQLHGMEACRIELYSQLLLECQAFSQHVSTFFTPSDVQRARRLLEGEELGEVADQFLAPPDAPPAFGPMLTRDQAVADFDGLLGVFCAWLQEARTAPSERVPGVFYPAPVAYDAERLPPYLEVAPATPARPGLEAQNTPWAAPCTGQRQPDPCATLRPQPGPLLPNLASKLTAPSMPSVP